MAGIKRTGSALGNIIRSPVKTEDGTGAGAERKGNETKRYKKKLRSPFISDEGDRDWKFLLGKIVDLLRSSDGFKHLFKPSRGSSFLSGK